MTVPNARFCKGCGWRISPSTWLKDDLDWKPWMALGLSVVPGLGQLYKGHLWQGLGWLVIVGLGYTAQPLGVILHLICAANAALGGALVFEQPGRRKRAGDNRGGG